MSKIPSLLSLSNIFARSARPDSTLTTGRCSSGQPADAPTGVDGKLRKEVSNPTAAARGEPRPAFAICSPLELGMDSALFSCNCLSDATISFIPEFAGHDARSSLAPLGEIGGDSVGGDFGGEMSVEVGEETRLLEKQECQQDW